jgi:hypothetical protein
MSYTKRSCVGYKPYVPPIKYGAKLVPSDDGGGLLIKNEDTPLPDTAAKTEQKPGESLTLVPTILYDPQVFTAYIRDYKNLNPDQKKSLYRTLLLGGILAAGVSMWLNK